MADIRRYPFVHHLRAEPTSYVIRYRRGDRVAGGRGLAFWFRRLATAAVEIPLEDRELQLHFHGRSADFQDVAVQAAATYRVVDPELLAARIDFTLDLASGRYVKTPLEHLAGQLTQIAQSFVWAYVVATPLATLLTRGVAEIDALLTEGFARDRRLAELGIEVTAVDVLAVRPTRELERALQTPELERLQQAADRATFERRAAAVEQERAISENELQSRIELTRREELLVEQQALNARERADSAAVATDIDARAEATRIESIETARVSAERGRMELYREVPVPVLHALALRDLAESLPSIDHLTISPDLVTPLLTRLSAARS